MDQSPAEVDLYESGEGEVEDEKSFKLSVMTDVSPQCRVMSNMSLSPGLDKA